MPAPVSAVAEFQPKLGAPDNTKLGHEIFTWSISAGASCPGATPACLSCCYALSGFFLMPNVAERHFLNWRFSQTEEFAPWMKTQIRATYAKTFRIHPAGDFYDAVYVRKWIEVVRALKRTQFFAYTRSWRVAEIHKELRKLAKLPNMSLWFSADVDTGEPPRIPNLRGVAWLARNEAEEQDAPEWADLVFREDHEKRLLKKAGPAAVQVCPNEIGPVMLTDRETGSQYEAARLTCTQCRICYSPEGARTPVNLTHFQEQS